MVEEYRMGWIPDYPDFRDYTPESEAINERLKMIREDNLVTVKAMLDKVGVTKPKKGLSLNVKEDLSPNCSPIEDQEALGSCTANAGVGLVEYFEKRAFGTFTNASRLFLYKVTRNLLGWTGDTGAYLRTTIGSMVLFGVPPEKYWPYIISHFDIEPSAFLYAFAQNYQAILYYRLDPPGITRQALLNQIKTYISYKLPSMFGFTVYNSYGQASTTGEIPYPVRGERAVGGHAVCAVGYDDTKVIKNASPGATPTTGALKIRNSWGTGWGNSGYGWLPYEYVLQSQAVDWWSLIKNEWVNSGQFGI
jgi:C1A family cysteine protease